VETGQRRRRDEQLRPSTSLRTSGVFREAARVLRRAGGWSSRTSSSTAILPAVVREDVEAYVGCIAGAMRREPYFRGNRGGGFAPAELLKDVDYIRPRFGEDRAFPTTCLRQDGGDRTENRRSRGKVRFGFYLPGPCARRPLAAVVERRGGGVPTEKDGI